MAIIKASRTFEGGELKQGAGSYLKSGTRLLNFRDKAYAEGAYVFILGAYKEDSAGNGVWYKPLKVRDNFGMDTKEKFAVQPNCPVDYFANRVKTHAPSFAKTEKVKRDGRDVNVYPSFGRTTWRVLYNAALFQNLNGGIHVLDLPQHGGASAIDEFVRGKGPDGAENPSICDYEAALPVHIKLDLQSTGQPWKIAVNSSKAYALDTKFADTEFLYNLDEVVTYPGKEELIEKLRAAVPPDLFAQCMAGYTDGSVRVSFSAPVARPPQLEEDNIPMGNPTFLAPRPVSQPLPVGNIPKANNSVPTAPRPAATNVAPAFSLPKAAAPSRPPQEPVAEPAEDTDDLPRSPIPQANTATMQAAKDFLKRSA